MLARVRQVEGAADSLASSSAHQNASRQLSESLIKGADSPLSLWVFKVSRWLHIGKINRVRGTRGKSLVCGNRGTCRILWEQSWRSMPPSGGSGVAGMTSVSLLGSSKSLSSILMRRCHEAILLRWCERGVLGRQELDAPVLQAKTTTVKPTCYTPLYVPVVRVSSTSLSSFLDETSHSDMRLDLIFEPRRLKTMARRV